ncbi:MAG TPA: pyridoxamine 5'-phosphate oxidase family protein [Acidimicrobiales bacterium]|nr:pyridoxamine 5'-phosphate oxidase family protein [Acidimicrobiales bacterium]
MRLSVGRCDDLLRQAERATLATVHPVRGVDAVPVCFSYDGERIAVPVDRVKPKSGAPLQRVRNLDADRRAVLLCDHWDRHDWSRLWWVRISLERVASPPDHSARLESLLEVKYHQYTGRPFAGLLVFGITGMIGWAASAEAARKVGS